MSLHMAPIFAKHQKRLEENHYQLSIYDFIQDGEVKPTNSCVKGLTRVEVKSQEVAPSETLPQVDEAQADETWKMEYLCEFPSSDLDIEIPTEDTDETLFSVGDVLTVRQASDVYNADEQPEDFYYIKEYEGEQVKLLNIRGDLLLCNTFNLDRNIWLRAHELIKI